MAQKPDTARNASGMERVGSRKLGYNVAQVDAFLERAHSLYETDDVRLTQQDIQEVSFDLARNGYVISQVDAALSRLERAVVDKNTEYDLAQRGRVAWKAETEAVYRDLLKHAKRDYRNRFAEGKKRRPSYDRKQVDDMVDQTLDKIAVMLGVKPNWGNDAEYLEDIDSTFVSNIIFTQRSGKHGYDERQVDYYLNTCIRLMSRLEAYERVSQYDSDDEDFAFENNSYNDENIPASFAPKSSSDTDSQNQELPKSVASSMAALVAATNAKSAAHETYPSFAPSAASDSSSAENVSEQNEDSNKDNIPNVPVAPNYEKQSIFPHVERDNDSSDDFNDLDKSEHALFDSRSSHRVIDNTDSDDELSQSATVLNNHSDEAKDSQTLPPMFPPAPSKRSANPIPSFPPAAPKSSKSESNGSSVFEEQHKLNLDIPELSFPIMNRLGTLDDDDSDDSSDDNPLLNDTDRK